MSSHSLATSEVETSCGENEEIDEEESMVQSRSSIADYVKVDYIECAIPCESSPKQCGVEAHSARKKFLKFKRQSERDFGLNCEENRTL